MNYRADLAFAVEQDRADPLATFRDRFHLPKRENLSEQIYFCGNSLGLQPKSAAEYVQQELRDWALLGVKAHFSGTRPWMPYHALLTNQAAALVGAKPGEVVNMNSLTVNLHLMLVSFYRPTRTRYKILIERSVFPSDRYAVASQLHFHGHDPQEALLEIAPREGETLVRMEDLETLLHDQGESVALILLPGVQYLSGQAFDMRRIAALGHERGATVGFDLAHAVGNIPLALHEWNADFAVWCNYKYMNAGPGAIAGCFVHERHAVSTELPRFAGWWGHDQSSRFQMAPTFRPTPGAEGWQLSNPPILALAPVLASLEIFTEAGMERLRAKSVALTGFLEFLLTERLGKRIEIITPAATAERGCQLSLRLCDPRDRARRLFEELEQAGVVCDWREPDVIRVAPTPLYNTFVEVFEFVERLEAALG
jgi:kynureninase